MNEKPAPRATKPKRSLAQILRDVFLKPREEREQKRFERRPEPPPKRDRLFPLY